MSWAEDMGFDAFDEDDFAGYRSDTREYEWEDKNHKIRLISDLDTSHIKAIIKRFEENHDPKLFWQQDWKLDYLKKEMAKRHKFPNKELF